MFRTLYEHGCLIEKTTLGAFSPSTGNTLPDRYIEGTCPICGYPGGPRRSVRQLRQPARPDRPDQTRARSSTGRRRSSARRSTSSSTCRRSPIGCVRGSTAQDRAGGRTSGTSRSRSSTTSSRGAMTRDIDWGIPVPVEGYAPRTEADLRLVRRGDRLPLGGRRVGARTAATPDAWRDWWQNPTRRTAYFMGKDNIVFHTVIWPSDAARLRRRAASSAPGDGELHLPTSVVASEFLTMEGKQLSTSRVDRDLRPRLARALRPGPAALLPHRRRARDAGQRLHVGGVPAAQQRRAVGELGQPRQPHARRTRSATSARCRSPASSPTRDREASRPSRRLCDRRPV